MRVARTLVGCITLLCQPCLLAAQPVVTIKLVGNELVAVPGYIAIADVMHSDLRVRSDVAGLECFIQSEPSRPREEAPAHDANRPHDRATIDCEGVVREGVQQYLVFRSSEGTVPIALIQPAREGDSAASLLPVLLSMGVAALALAIAVTRRPRHAADTERLAGVVRELRQHVSSLASKVRPPISPSALMVPSPSASDGPSSEQPRPDRHATERPRAEDDLQRLLDAAIAWRTAVGRVPESFCEAHGRLEDLRGQAGSHTQAFITRSTALVQTALNHSDTHCDPRLEQRAVQEALMHLIATADLTLISAANLDPPDGDLHEVVGRDPSPDLAHRNTVSRVTRRGLRRANAIVSRAEVYVYD